jgi:hypothetical protein
VNILPQRLACQEEISFALYVDSASERYRTTHSDAIQCIHRIQIAVAAPCVAPALGGGFETLPAKPGQPDAGRLVK